MSHKRTILRIGHSPDPDDAFMWWPLLRHGSGDARIDTGQFHFEPVLADIETLNRRSLSGELEITAMSCAQYPFVKERYALTACGASMGDNYGPKLVARDFDSLDELAADAANPIVAIPGERTSAFAALNLMIGRGRIRHAVVAFEEIIDRVADGEFQAGLVIHEGQLTFEDAGLRLLADVGQWWTGRTGLPLPLGVNAVRRDLDSIHGRGTLQAVTRILTHSIKHALANRDQAVTHSLQHARGLSMQLADRFVAMYVNKWSVDMGSVGRQAVQTFLNETSRIGLTPSPGQIEVVDA